MIGFIGWLKGKAKSEKQKMILKRRKVDIKLKDIRFQVFQLKGESPRQSDCQDSFMIIKENGSDFKIFGVFDGNGSSGKEASNSASENLHKYFVKNNKKVVKATKYEDL